MCKKSMLCMILRYNYLDVDVNLISKLKTHNSDSDLT